MTFKLLSVISALLSICTLILALFTLIGCQDDRVGHIQFLLLDFQGTVLSNNNSISNYYGIGIGGYCSWDSDRGDPRNCQAPTTPFWFSLTPHFQEVAQIVNRDLANPNFSLSFNQDTYRKAFRAAWTLFMLSCIFSGIAVIQLGLAMREKYARNYGCRIAAIFTTFFNFAYTISASAVATAYARKYRSNFTTLFGRFGAVAIIRSVSLGLMWGASIGALLAFVASLAVYYSRPRDRLTPRYPKERQFQLSSEFSGTTY